MLKVLVVDDDDIVRSVVVDLLNDHVAHVQQCDSVKSALSCLEQANFDVVLCDMYMPEAPGLELIRQLGEQQRDLAFVFMSGKPELPDVIAALRFHAADFLTKPFTREQLLAALNSACQVVDHQRELACQVAALSCEVESKSKQLREALTNLEITQRSSLEAMVVALEARERETCAHSFRVRAYTLLLANHVQYPCELISELETAALLHDIGKIAIPDSILLKPGKLTTQEFEFCKKHTVIGAQILSSIPAYLRVADIVRHHHERWDGMGYPDCQKENNILLGSRLFAIADTFDAITSDRCYRGANSVVNAQKEILRCGGAQFDPSVVEVFLRIPESKWLEVRGAAEQAFFSGAGRISSSPLDAFQAPPVLHSPAASG